MPQGAKGVGEESGRRSVPVGRWVVVGRGHKEGGRAAGTWVAVATRAVLALLALQRRRDGSGARLGRAAATRRAVACFELAAAPRPPLARLAEPREPEAVRVGLGLGLGLGLG